MPDLDCWKVTVAVGHKTWWRGHATFILWLKRVAFLGTESYSWRLLMASDAKYPSHKRTNNHQSWVLTLAILNKLCSHRSHLPIYPRTPEFHGSYFPILLSIPSESDLDCGHGYFFVCVSINLSIGLAICWFCKDPTYGIVKCFHLSVCLSVHPSIRPSVHPSIYMNTHHNSICLERCVWVCLCEYRLIDNCN